MEKRTRFTGLIPVLNAKKVSKEEGVKKKPHFLSEITLLCHSLCGGGKPEDKSSPEDVSTVH